MNTYYELFQQKTFGNILPIDLGAAFDKLKEELENGTEQAEDAAAWTEREAEKQQHEDEG